MRFRTEDGTAVVVEGVEDGSGTRLVSRGDGPAQAARTFEGSLEGVRAAAASALRVFRDGSLKPDTVELEFGVKLTAEAGAIIAKGSAEGHLVVKLSWSPGQGGTDTGPGTDPSAGAAGSAGSAGTDTVPGADGISRTDAVPGTDGRAADRS